MVPTGTILSDPETWALDGLLGYLETELGCSKVSDDALVYSVDMLSRLRYQPGRDLQGTAPAAPAEKEMAELQRQVTRLVEMNARLRRNPPSCCVPWQHCCRHP